MEAAVRAQASADGEGQDEFVFQISKDEYLDLLFEDLALPNLKKNQQRQLTEYKTHRAGYTANGVPANISVVRSLQNSLARRTAMTAGKRRELHALEEDLDTISKSEPAQLLEEERLRKEIAELRAKIDRVPFIDTFDLRYKNYEKRPEPSSQAVMFCLMDVSGSMDQATKDMAKRFYILLYLFLSRTYKNVDVVYIRHHTQAKEVDEHEFFYSQETGGTIVSSALKLMDEVVKERYDPAQWNIYAAQASDGDNWADDSPLCHELLAKKILPVVRYYSYIEITRRAHQTLWREYEHLQSTFENFAMQHIRDRKIFIRCSVNCFISKPQKRTVKPFRTASTDAGCFFTPPYPARACCRVTGSISAIIRSGKLSSWYTLPHLTIICRALSYPGAQSRLFIRTSL
ncbi:YeaH [Klebsiella michiganensis]|uniref:YeaH n=1 Tax=Klebsiella michiganensis TaxID=1134687 RepID=A0A7H4LUS3_9ENTR|nr:YeaH [Klebsiella michiganensis]